MDSVVACSFAERLQTLVNARIKALRMQPVTARQVERMNDGLRAASPPHTVDAEKVEMPNTCTNTVPMEGENEADEAVVILEPAEEWYDAVETPESAELVEAAPLANAAEPVQPVPPVQPIEPVQTIEPIKPIKTVESIEPVRPSDLLELDDPLIPDEVDQRVVPVDPDEPLILFEPIEGRVEPAILVQPVRSIETTPKLEPLEPLSRVEPMPVEEPDQRTEKLHVLGEDPLEKYMTALPDWFLEHCVRCFEDLQGSEDSLVVRNDFRPEDNKLDEHRSNRSQSYQVGRSVWQPLLAIHASCNENFTSSVPAKAFSHDAALIRFPDRHREDGGSRFLNAVVERFALEAGADLVSLSIDEILDLPGYSSQNPTRIDQRTAEALVQAPNIKRKQDPEKYPNVRTAPLIVHIPDVHRMIDIRNEWAQLNDLRHALASFKGNAILLTTTSKAFASKSRSIIDPISDNIVKVREVLEDNCVLSNTVLPVFKHYVSKYEAYINDGSNFETAKRLEAFDAAVLASTGSNPVKRAICMTPFRSPGQRQLYESDRRHEASVERRNIRLLQRVVRHMFPATQHVDLFRPFLKWTFLQDTRSATLLTTGRIGESEMYHLLSSVYDLLEVGDFEEAILQMGSRKDTTEGWCMDGEGIANSHRWSSFPARIQDVVRQIESEPKKYELEQQLLNQIVNPVDIRDSWSDIAIDQDVKRSITKLVQQQLGKGESSYGVLRDNRIGGAMLYGPPGTGKTHLARIVARELDVLMIAITAADLNHMWVGQTEKSIKALFNLARMVSPSMIFIDEADALLRGRRSQDHAHHRIAMNQLLQEMDGLNKSMTAPFVLISTNFPRDLDHAVLRRVPRRIYIGLPSQAQRVKIFRICLKDETIGDDVDMNQLAKLSRGFSGSDITTVCVQAALFCETSTGNRRVLHNNQFRKAFQKCTTSVSKMSLAAILGFAKEFDPHTYDKLLKDGQEAVS